LNATHHIIGLIPLASRAHSRILSICFQLALPKCRRFAFGGQSLRPPFRGLADIIWQIERRTGDTGSRLITAAEALWPALQTPDQQDIAAVTG